MIMFGIVYLMLFVLWIMLLNNKIQHGPEPVGAGGGEPTGAMHAASRRAGHERSMTETS
jgi:cytochrome d ubiquinol oxidase subunit I